MFPRFPIARRDFLRLTGIAAGSLAVAPAYAAAEGLSEVPRSRTDRLATGANVCLWFRFPQNNSVEHFTDYISAAEADYMAHIGLKHVRLCVAPQVIMNPSSGDILAERGRQLEAAIERFHRAGLAVVVDIHNEDRRDELDPKWQEAFVRFWGLLAERLSRFDPEMTILEIINEPVFDRHEEEWNTLNARLAAAIRHGAPRHTIITSGPNWGGIDGLKKLKLLPDRNVIYSFHCYDPFTFTHQGATWTSPAVQAIARRALPVESRGRETSPGGVGILAGLEEEWSSGTARSVGTRRSLPPGSARESSGVPKNHVPLYCGEFGVYPARSKPEDRSRWFHDFGEVLAENRIGWAVWGWDEGFGLNRKMVNGKPVVDAVVAQALGLKLS